MRRPAAAGGPRPSSSLASPARKLATTTDESSMLPRSPTISSEQDRPGEKRWSDVVEEVKGEDGDEDDVPPTTLAAPLASVFGRHMPGGCWASWCEGATHIRLPSTNGGT